MKKKIVKCPQCGLEFNPDTINKDKPEEIFAKPVYGINIPYEDITDKSKDIVVSYYGVFPETRYFDPNKDYYTFANDSGRFNSLSKYNNLFDDNTDIKSDEHEEDSIEEILYEEKEELSCINCRYGKESIVWDVHKCEFFDEIINLYQAQDCEYYEERKSK